MPQKLSKEEVVTTWAHVAIKDFFIGFFLDDKFPRYSTFFYYQGLEKICKSYVLGTLATEYESLPFKSAKDKINKLAKDTNKMGHNLKGMIEKLESVKVLNDNILENTYTKHNNKPVTVKNIIEILESAYLECRYPVPNGIYRNYPMEGYENVYWEPIGSSEPKTFAFDLGLKIINKIEQDFNVDIRKNIFTSSIDDDEWERFSRIFFKTF